MTALAYRPPITTDSVDRRANSRIDAQRKLEALLVAEFCMVQHRVPLRSRRCRDMLQKENLSFTGTTYPP
jgi:hypothetical protein